MPLFKHRMHGLSRDFDRTERDFARKAGAAVERTARDGHRTGVRLATKRSGRHGKHYPKSWKVWKINDLAYFYGPDPSMRQGGMSFEQGSRNQSRPHREMADSTNGLNALLARRLHVAAVRSWHV